MSKKSLIDDGNRILMSLEDGFLRADTEGYITMANMAIAKMCGYSSPEKMIGLHMKTLYANPDDRNKMVKQIKAEGKLLNYKLKLK